MPVVEMTGEIYVRAVDFSNDHLVEKLEQRGLRVRLAPQSEWLAYCGHVRRGRDDRNRLVDQFSNHVHHRIEAAGLAAIAPELGWPTPPTIEETIAAARPYVSAALEGEAVLTVGASLESWRRKQLDAVVAVGPLECMPTKIAEAQFHHIAEQDGLLTLTLAFNGDPVSTTALDNFAFEVHARFQKRLRQTLAQPSETRPQAAARCS
jgi:predicted nucleotide-binding protein (sugar kinase/HSP70/actin superfamily)